MSEADKTYKDNKHGSRRLEVEEIEKKEGKGMRSADSTATVISIHHDHSSGSGWTKMKSTGPTPLLIISDS